MIGNWILHLLNPSRVEGDLLSLHRLRPQDSGRGRKRVNRAVPFPDSHMAQVEGCVTCRGADRQTALGCMCPWPYLTASPVRPFSSCCSFMKSCPTLCNPMNGSTPGFPVLHYLLEFAQTHVHWFSDAIQPSHPLLPPSPPAFNLSQHHSLFQCVGSSYQVMLWLYGPLSAKWCLCFLIHRLDLPQLLFQGASIF